MYAVPDVPEDLRARGAGEQPRDGHRGQPGTQGAEQQRGGDRGSLARDDEPRAPPRAGLRVGDVHDGVRDVTQRYHPAHQPPQ